jgi:hypothetical protein
MTTKELTEDQQRVHGYLMSQGEKYSWLELWPRVLSPRLQLIEALDGLTTEQAEARTSADEWTIMEGLRHEIAVTRATLHNVERLAGVSVSDATQERDPEELSLEELRRELILNGTQFGTLAAALPEDAPLEPTAPHGNFGDLHCRAWYIFQRIHDVDHVNQFHSIREAPEFPAGDAG